MHGRFCSVACDANASYPHFKTEREPKEIDAQRVATDVWYLHYVISQSIPSGMHVTDHIMNLPHMRSQCGSNRLLQEAHRDNNSFYIYKCKGICNHLIRVTVKSI